MSVGAEAVIKVTGLTIGWGEVVLMRELSFEVPRGEVFAILGGSGCGKSTLLRHLIGLEVAMAGTVDVLGRDPVEAQRGRPPFGVLFQSGALLGSMTLGENVALPLRTWTRLAPEAVEAIVRAKLALVGLEGFENHLPAEISGGMKKRAGIARAMALDPSVLFLDEPSAGLDPISAVELDDLILTLSRSLGMTTVIVTHELPSIFKIATSCIMLEKTTQGIIARGDPRQLRERDDEPQVWRFFNRQAAPAAASS